MAPSFSPPPETSAIFRPLSSASLFSLPPSPPPSPPTPIPEKHSRRPRQTPPTQPRTDLGDDDSFSPDIVSGYHFNLPLARESQPLLHAFAQSNTSQEHHPDHDHRTDAVYDDLDDIGDWVANTAAPGTADLTKKLARAVSRGNAIEAAPHIAGTAERSVAVANNALSLHRRVEDRRRDNHLRDKLDRATVEQVLDPRTRMILFRLLSRNRLRTLDGCVSTGKEANVYYATAAADPNAASAPDDDLQPNPALMPSDFAPDVGVAVKVFKTSILQFKDRERYVAGEFRFRRGGYQRGSNRKMVQQWAEKEFRNQIRLQEAGIPAPVPLLLKPPVLVMSFFGRDGWPAPRLKDANLSTGKLVRAYFRSCVLMRWMFRRARLVHGDLSEYNMLYWKGEVIIIDVSQSVEDDHPMALDFLRRDCANVNDFFRRSGGVTVLGVRELFDFVTGEDIGDEDAEEEAALHTAMDIAASRDAEATAWTKQDDEVFMKSYIPRTLQEVELREKEYRDATRPGEELDQNLFAKLTGLMTLAQKRERSLEKVADSSASGVVAANGQRDDVHMPNLEIPCVEPATTRTLLSPEKLRRRSSSPCTSNSTRSSKLNADEQNVNRIPRILEENRKIDAVQALHAGSSIFDEAATDVQEVEDEDDDVSFGDHEYTDSSSGDIWIHKEREEAADPFMGLSKKEWKKQVKTENRERRENKVPKHVKKRKDTMAKRRRGTK